ncbi:hypothetical protein MLPF_2108 [Mycobacterium lepromatosis]|nr:hypothetical protein MLPF_2108 [Mycobacterium lepromatosis]
MTRTVPVSRLRLAANSTDRQRPAVNPVRKALLIWKTRRNRLLFRNLAFDLIEPDPCGHI